MKLVTKLAVVLLAAGGLFGFSGIHAAGTASASEGTCTRTTLVRGSDGGNHIVGVRVHNTCASSIYVMPHAYGGGMDRSGFLSTVYSGDNRTIWADFWPSYGTLICGEWVNSDYTWMGRDCVTV